MGGVAIADVEALTGGEGEFSAGGELDEKGTAEAVDDVALGAPMIGEVTGRMFDDAHANVGVILSAP